MTALQWDALATSMFALAVSAAAWMAYRRQIQVLERKREAEFERHKADIEARVQRRLRGLGA